MLHSRPIRRPIARLVALAALLLAAPPPALAWGPDDHPMICELTETFARYRAEHWEACELNPDWHSALHFDDQGPVSGHACNAPDHHQSLYQTTHPCPQPSCFYLAHNQSHFGDATGPMYGDYLRVAEEAANRAVQGWGEGCCEAARDYLGFAMHFGQDRTAAGHAWNPPNYSYSAAGFYQQHASYGRMHGQPSWLGGIFGVPSRASIGMLSL